MNTYASGETARLTAKLNPADVTMSVNTNLGVNKGRVFMINDTQVEWVSFTSNTLTNGVYILAGLTRGLSQTADPSTAGTGLTWLANQQVILVAMHDQLPDRQEGFPPVQKTTAAIISQNSAAALSLGAIFWDTTQGGLTYWNGSTPVLFPNGGSIGNATTSTTGVEQLPTQAQVDAGTDTGSIGPMSVQPSQLQKTVQKGAQVSLTTSGTDTYTGGTTPALTAYTSGMSLIVKIGTTNTTAATLNVNSLGAKSITRQDGSTLVAGDLVTGTEYVFVYDGTNFQRIGALKATDAQATAGTDTTTFVTPAQFSLRNRYFDKLAVAATSSGTGETTVYTGSVTAGILSTYGALEFTGNYSYGTTSGGTITGQIRFKLGGTTFATLSIVSSGSGASTAGSAGTFSCTIMNNASAAIQKSFASADGVFVNQVSAVNITGISNDTQTGAVDTTSTQTALVTVQTPTAGAVITIDSMLVKIIR